MLSSPTRRVWILALATMVAAGALTIPARQLWEPDEPRYCESAREMLASGDWVLPRLNGELYGHKPPIFMWLVAVGRLAGLNWTAAGVLPSLLPFLALLLVFPVMARGWGLSRPTGELAAALLSSTLLAMVMALGARMDTLLAVLFTVSLWLAARLLFSPSTAQRLAATALWVVLALATLTKGPVVLALFGLTVVVTWVVAQPRPPLRALFLAPGPWVGVAVVFAWLIPAGLRGGPDFLHEILIRQSAGRMVESFAHSKPFYYHLVSYPITGLPFAVVALLAALHTLRRRDSAGATLLAATVVVVLGFFSLLSGKLVIYLLPMFPAAALLAAEAIIIQGRGVRAGLYWGATGMLVVGIGVASAPWLRAELQPVAGILVAAGVAVGACAATALISLMWRRPALQAAGYLVAAGLLLPAVVFPAAVRALNPTMHLEAVARVVQELEPHAGDGFVFRMNVSGPSLYTERIFRKLRTPEELEEKLRAGRAVIVEEKIWRRVSSQFTHLPLRATVFQFRTGPLFVLRAALPSPASEESQNTGVGSSPTDLPP